MRVRGTREIAGIWDAVAFPRSSRARYTRAWYSVRPKSRSFRIRSGFTGTTRTSRGGARTARPLFNLHTGVGRCARTTAGRTHRRARRVLGRPQWPRLMSPRRVVAMESRAEADGKPKVAAPFSASARRGPTRKDGAMIQPAEQANIIGLKSQDFVKWVDRNIDAPLKKGPIRKLLDAIVGDFFNWAKRNSTWPLHFGIMCCAIEMAATSDPRYDAERFGIIYRSSPRQCDVLLLNGPISLKLRPAVRRLYEQMAEPKWVIAMGECTICGGPYYDSYSVVKGSYTFLPTDVFIPGCPVRPEALIDGFLKLSAKIKAEKRGWIKTKKGRLVDATKGQLAEFEGDYTYEVKAVRPHRPAGPGPRPPPGPF